jgi:hypothetical protein
LNNGINVTEILVYMARNRRMEDWKIGSGRMEGWKKRCEREFPLWERVPTPDMTDPLGTSEDKS